MFTSLSRQRHLLIAASAAFCTYFCMYSFRKPFTAASFENEQVFDVGLKAVLIVAQISGYLLSKFIGIKVISELRREQRLPVIVSLVVIAELALVGFAFLPPPLKVVMMFLNGLPLGMVFGVVLSYLEGRQQTEALSAALCASFITASGVMKSVGQWLLDQGVDPFFMPLYAGLIFLVPFLISVAVLQATPAPDAADRRQRHERQAMNGVQRRIFLGDYWPGISLVVFVYVLLTVLRTIRDDFGVEIWKDLGVTTAPSIFTQTELVVALCVSLLNGLVIWIRGHLTALRTVLGLMGASFVLVLASAALQATGRISPFGFMVACGIGLYVPYVAVHTTIFERLIAASRRPCNLGFLMYVADAVGYLGYTIVIVVKYSRSNSTVMLPFFQRALVCGAVLSIIAILGALFWFERMLGRQPAAEPVPAPAPPQEEFAT